MPNINLCTLMHQESGDFQTTFSQDCRSIPVKKYRSHWFGQAVVSSEWLMAE
jgi:hypothetical protein